MKKINFDAFVKQHCKKIKNYNAAGLRQTDLKEKCKRWFLKKNFKVVVFNEGNRTELLVKNKDEYYLLKCIRANTWKVCLEENMILLDKGYRDKIYLLNEKEAFFYKLKWG
jgi:hypothetical protein